MQRNIELVSRGVENSFRKTSRKDEIYGKESHRKRNEHLKY